jgi:hypothetical protein
MKIRLGSATPHRTVHNSPRSSHAGDYQPSQTSNGLEVLEEITTARAAVNEQYAAFDKELAPRLPSAVPASSMSRPATGASMRPRSCVGTTATTHSRTGTGNREQPRRALQRPPPPHAGPPLTANNRGPDLATLCAETDGLAMPGSIDEALAPFASEQAKRRLRTAQEIRNWQEHAKLARSQFQSIAAWAHQSLDHALERDVLEMRLTSNGISSNFRVASICTVLISVLQSFCPDKSLASRVLDEVLSLIYVEWEPGSAALEPFPHDFLAHAGSFLEELDVCRGTMKAMRVTHENTAASMKHFRIVSQRLVNRAQLATGRLMFRCWRMLTARRKKSLVLLSNRVSTRQRRSVLFSHFNGWRNCARQAKIAAALLRCDAANGKIVELESTVATVVSAARSEVEQELITVKTKLFEETELRETQLSAFTAEIDDLAVQLNIGRKLLMTMSMERLLWRSLWLTHHRETTLPEKCPHVMAQENARMQESMRALHAAEAAYLESQTSGAGANVRRRSSSAVTVADVPAVAPTDCTAPASTASAAAGAAPINTPLVTEIQADAEQRPTGAAAPVAMLQLSGGFDDTLPSMQRARFVLRQSVESLLTMWSNNILSKLGSSRILLSLKDDLADGEIFAALCYALERPTPTFEFVGNHSNTVVNGKTLLDTVKLCVQRSVACPGHQPLLNHCPVFADRLDEHNILISTTGASDDVAWYSWILATLFIDYCWQQLCNVDEADPLIRLDDWNVLSCNTTRHKSSAASSTVEADESTERMIIAEKVLRRERAISMKNRAGPRRGSVSGSRGGSQATVRGASTSPPTQREGGRRESLAPSTPGTTRAALGLSESTADRRRRSSVAPFPPHQQQARLSVVNVTAAPRRPSAFVGGGADSAGAQSVSLPAARPKRRQSASQPGLAASSSSRHFRHRRDGNNSSSDSDVDDGFDEDDFLTPAVAALSRSRTVADEFARDPPAVIDEALMAKIADETATCERMYAKIRKLEEFEGVAHRAALYLRKDFHPQQTDLNQQREQTCREPCQIFPDVQELCRTTLGVRHAAAVAANYDACRAYALHKESVERKKEWHDMAQQITQAIVVFRCLEAQMPESPAKRGAKGGTTSTSFRE